MDAGPRPPAVHEPKLEAGLSTPPSHDGVDSILPEEEQMNLMRQGHRLNDLGRVQQALEKFQACYEKGRRIEARLSAANMRLKLARSLPDKGDDLAPRFRHLRDAIKEYHAMLSSVTHGKLEVTVGGGAEVGTPSEDLEKQDRELLRRRLKAVIDRKLDDCHEQYAVLQTLSERFHKPYSIFKAGEAYGDTHGSRDTHGALTITILEVRNAVCRTDQDKADPYVTVRSGGKGTGLAERKTGVKNAEAATDGHKGGELRVLSWEDEPLKWSIVKPADLERAPLEITLWDRDFPSSDDKLGWTTLHLTKELSKYCKDPERKLDNVPGTVPDRKKDLMLLDSEATAELELILEVPQATYGEKMNLKAKSTSLRGRSKGAREPWKQQLACTVKLRIDWRAAHAQQRQSGELQSGRLAEPSVSGSPRGPGGSPRSPRGGSRPPSRSRRESELQCDKVGFKFAKGLEESSPGHPGHKFAGVEIKGSSFYELLFPSDCYCCTKRSAAPPRL